MLHTLRLLGTYLVKQLAHGTSIGEVLVTGVIQFPNHFTGQHLRLRCKDILLRLGKDLHNLIQLIRIIVLDIQEITETAAHTGVDTEKILHLRTVTGSDDNELTTVVLHTLHQLLQSLGTLIVTVTALTDRSQRVSLIHEEDTAHRLVTQTVNHLRGLTLIRTHHLRTVTLYDMTAVKITYCLQNLTQFTGNRRLARTGITR